MKRILIFMLCLLTLLGTTAQDFTDADKQQMEYAIYFMDNGMPDKSIEILTELDAKYPNTPNIIYEIGYAYYIKNDYKSALKIFNQLEKMPPVSERVYQMAGNTLDMMGKRKEAAKKYKEGLKHHPDSYIILLELGNLDFQDEKYYDALQYYEQALTVNPAYASAFYRAGYILLNSDTRVWGLFYGEAMRLLEPNSKRSQEMAKWMAEVYKQCIDINNGTIHIHINEKNVIDAVNTNPSTDMFYEMMLPMGMATSFSEHHAPLAITLASIISGREKAMEACMELGSNVSLLDFQQQVKKAGHWEAYNYWMFRPGFEEEANKWLDEHEEEFDAFVEWYKTHAFKPTSDEPTHRLNQRKVTHRKKENIADVLKTPEGCRENNQNAQRLANLWLNNDSLDDASRQAASSFVFMWVVGTDEYKFELGGDLLNGFTSKSEDHSTSVNSDLSTAYIMAMVSYAFANDAKEFTPDMHYAAINRTLEYFEAHQEKFELTPGLNTALIARREGRLRDLTDADFAKLRQQTQAE